MTSESPESSFWSVNLQESIQAAGQQNKPLLCFVTDGSPVSLEWLETIADGRSSKATADATVRLRILKDSQEFTFLTGVCPLRELPALVLIRAGQIEEKWEHPETSVKQLSEKLSALYPSSDQDTEVQTASNTDGLEQCLEFGPSTGRMRLSNNAYDALRDQTEKWKAQSISPKNILLLQLRLLEKVSSLKETISEIKSRRSSLRPELPEDAVDRLLNTPASALQPRQTSPSSNFSSSSSPQSSSTPGRTALPPTGASPSASSEPAVDATNARQPSDLPTARQSQRNEYVKQQREREAAQRLERERIKAQIKSDREERRRIDDLRKQSELASLREQNSTTSSPSSTDIRIQVRTFDGSTLRTTFPNTAKIASDVRAWIDQSKTDNNANNAPYSLKLILTPLPNRNIEAGEEEKTLPELGIVGSATMVMVPVKSYVDSYVGSGSAMGVFGGLLGATGRLVDWLLGMIGYGSNSSPQTQSQPQPQSEQQSGTQPSSEESASATASGSKVKVRTLADQRADEQRKRGNQLYNGNSLDFQGRADDDQKKD